MTLKIEAFKRWRILNDGTRQLQGTSPKLVDIFGNAFPSGNIVIRTPYRSGNTATLNIKATNLRVRWNKNKLLSDENKCKRGISGAQFEGGQVDTGHLMVWSYVSQGVETITQDFIVGKMISPGIEFVGGDTVYISEDNGQLRTKILLGVAAPEISAPRIISVSRLDGGDVNEAGSLEVENYFCSIDREPTWTAGTDMTGQVPSTGPRNGTALWSAGTAQYHNLNKNQDGAWSLEVT